MVESVPEDEYREPASEGADEIKVRGSRFVAAARIVRTIGEAEAALAAIRKAAYDATHHCSAYRIGPEGESTRFQDDGEPSGSAGGPILRQIEGRGLTHVLVVVTRYYGGTKLGTGGLARAYSEAAALALDAAGERKVVRRTAVNLRFAYDDTSPALHVVHQFDAEVSNTQYGDDTRMEVRVRKSQVPAFQEAFTEALAGRGSAQVVDE